MTQSLSNLMASPLVVAALFLWVLLAFLAFRQCRVWAKGHQKEKVIQKNHPAIPVKKYELSQIASDVSAFKPTKVSVQPKLSMENQARRLASLQKAWDT